MLHRGWEPRKKEGTPWGWFNQLKLYHQFGPAAGCMQGAQVVRCWPGLMLTMEFRLVGNPPIVPFVNLVVPGCLTWAD